MSVADHLSVQAEEYDERIRTYVPHYEALLEGVASCVRLLDRPAPVIVDLGVGTGALADRCLEACPEGRLVGVDADPEMLRVARARLASRGGAELVRGDFLDVELPACDAVVACLALHHVPTGDAKRRLYRRCRDALRPGGLLVSADRFRASDPVLDRADREAWLRHLRRWYSDEEARGHLAAWAEEDVYFPLAEETAWLEEAGLRPDVIWRVDGLAVLVGRCPG